MKARHDALWLIAAIVLSIATPARAAEVQVAVASNFAQPMQQIAEAFTRDTGHRAVVTTGATGTLFAQIEGGAPFEMFLSADSATPGKLSKDGFALDETRFTYAFGVLALWSAKPRVVDPAGAVLKTGAFSRLAIANPKLAPYGAAAIESLTSLGLLARLQSKLVQGETIAQTFQFVASGNADIGFVALSQITTPDGARSGSSWIVPGSLHTPIQQDAVVLRKGAASPAAASLCTYLRGSTARAIVRSYGYELPPPAAP
jgi:molybdate transport system substrate-binding protein